MRLLRLFVLLGAGFAAVAPAWAEHRVALVLGNGGYMHVAKLPNPAKDAESMAALLKADGFEVIAGSDLTREQMVERVSEFAAALSNGADAAVIFYAGHGIQIAGKNYLIPVDANLRSTYDVKANTIDADDIVDSASSAKVKLVLLDACRNNPFADQMSRGDVKSRSVAGNSGLAAMQSAEGTMISFATSPGATALDGEGGHSPFTVALLHNLDKPGVEINDAMTQVRAEVQENTSKQQQPWANTNLTGKFYMIPPAETAVASIAPAPAAPAAGGSGIDANQAAVIETTIWQSAEKSGRREEYALYLSKYPKGSGLYSDLAELRLAALDPSRSATTSAAAPSATPTPAALAPPGASLDLVRLKSEDATSATEDALAFDLAKWREVQAKLTSIGFSTGGATGAVGPATRRAITAWQTARGYKVSGYLNQLQADALALDKPSPAIATRNAPAGPTRNNPAVATRNVGANGARKNAGAAHPNGYAAAPEDAAPNPGANGFMNAVGAGIGLGLGAAVGCKLTHCY